MMKSHRPFASFVLVLLVALSWVPLSASPTWAHSLPPSNGDGGASGNNGNFLVYSLQFLGVQVSSKPGIIKDGVVAYAGGCGDSCYFTTDTTADPRSFTFKVDAWNAALSGFLVIGRSMPLTFFTWNDGSTGTGTPVTMNGPKSHGEGKGWVCLDGTGSKTACDGSGNPVVIGPIQRNAEHKLLHDLEKTGAAFAILFPAFSPVVTACSTPGVGGPGCSSDSVSTQLDLDTIRDGGDLLEPQEVTVTPEPMAMVLGATGLIMLGYAARRRVFGT